MCYKRTNGVDYLPFVFSRLELFIVFQGRHSSAAAVHLDVRRSFDFILGRRQKLLEHGLQHTHLY